MDVKEFLSKDRFAVLLGIELLEAANGKAKAKLDIKEEHLNALDIAQGGVITQGELIACFQGMVYRKKETLF